VNNWAKHVQPSLSQAALDQQAAAAYSATSAEHASQRQYTRLRASHRTAFNDDVVLDASEAKVHISHILWVITKHAHDRGPKMSQQQNISFAIKLVSEELSNSQFYSINQRGIICVCPRAIDPLRHRPALHVSVLASFCSCRCLAAILEATPAVRQK
jgi:hypothetical protein